MAFYFLNKEDIINDDKDDSYVYLYAGFIHSLQTDMLFCPTHPVVLYKMGKQHVLVIRSRYISIINYFKSS